MIFFLYNVTSKELIFNDCNDFEIVKIHTNLIFYTLYTLMNLWFITTP